MTPDKLDNHDDPHKYYPFLQDGLLHTAFMIYVRCYNKLSDEDFMNLLGLHDYHKTALPIMFGSSHVGFANDSEWTHIADDLRYTLWHSPKTVEAIAELSKRYDVFRNSMGDIDDSFEFEYYHSGKLVRKFVFDYIENDGTLRVTTDIGTKLPGEPETFSSLKSSAQKMLPDIIQTLGIVKVTNPLQYRFYCKNQEG